MKKIGEYTARGMGAETDGAIKISLFDGRFDTGYKVTGFSVFSQSVQDTYDNRCAGKLCTSSNCETAAATFMNLGDNREIAWAGQNDGSIDAIVMAEGIIDPENFIVEDLWIYLRSNQNENVNYIITMEKYDTTEWQGALTLARGKQMGDD